MGEKQDGGARAAALRAEPPYWLGVWVALACLLGACAPSPTPERAASGASATGAPAPAPVSAHPATAPAQPTMPTTPRELLPVTINWTAPAGVMSPFWVGYETGLYREQGLDANLVHIANTSQAAQAMLAGEVQISLLDPAAVMQASVNGADLVMLYGQQRSLNFAIMSLPAIREPQELKGKSMGISRLGSASHTAALVALRTWGLEPDRDVALRQLGDFGNVLPAFETGQLDAATVGLPVRRATRARFNMLLNLGTDGPAFPTTVISAQRSWAAANAEAVLRFGRAHMLAIQRVKKDRALTMELIRKYMQLDDPEVLEDEYDHAVSVTPDVPWVDEQGVALVLEFLAGREPSLAGRQAAEWIEPRFMRELETSGFVHQVTGR